MPDMFLFVVVVSSTPRDRPVVMLAGWHKKKARGSPEKRVFLYPNGTSPPVLVPLNLVPFFPITPDLILKDDPAAPCVPVVVGGGGSSSSASSSGDGGEVIVECPEDDGKSHKPVRICGYFFGDVSVAGTNFFCKTCTRVTCCDPIDNTLILLLKSLASPGESSVLTLATRLLPFLSFRFAVLWRCRRSCTHACRRSDCPHSACVAPDCPHRPCGPPGFSRAPVAVPAWLVVLVPSLSAVFVWVAAAGRPVSSTLNSRLCCCT